MGEKEGEMEPKADDGHKNEEKGEKLDKASLNKIVDEETELDFVITT
jgi:hypothetical protein